MVKETLLEISTSDHGEFSAHLVGGTWGSGFSAHLVGGMRERFFSTPAGWYEGAESCYSLHDLVITCKLVLCHILCYIHFTQHCLSDTNFSSSIFSLHYLADRFAHAPALCMHLLRRESHRLRLSPLINKYLARLYLFSLSCCRWRQETADQQRQLPDFVFASSSLRLRRIRAIGTRRSVDPNVPSLYACVCVCTYKQ